MQVRHKFTAAIAAAAFGAIAATPALAQTKIKFATYVPQQHGVAKYLEANLKEAMDTSGDVELSYFPGAQLGPPPKYYDMALSGQAEITWFLHGNTPGIFPLTEIATIPLLFGSAEIGTKVLNDPEIRKHITGEHDGLHIIDLHTHQPANIYTGKTPINTVADFKGLRLRVPSGPVRQLAVNLGATPDGMPPTQWAEALQKGTLDGVFTDYGGAGLAFRIGPVTAYATELYVYVGSFCVCMNQKAWDGLPGGVRDAITANFAKDVAGSGKAFDHLDPIGKNLMMEQGTKPINFSDAEMAKFRAAAEKVAAAAVEDVEKKGLPGKEVYALMQKLAAKYEPESKNFWKMN